jgi:hypothetical protein
MITLHGLRLNKHTKHYFRNITIVSMPRNNGGITYKYKLCNS